jgi:hypothetical protein
MSARSAVSHLLAGRTVIDQACGGRRGRLLSIDPDAGTVTVLWAGGSYNTLKMEPGRFAVMADGT